MRTEIDKDFTIERHKEYTVIWPFRTYSDEEDKGDKEEKKTDYWACWLWLFFIIIYSLLVALLIKVLPRD